VGYAGPIGLIAGTVLESAVRSGLEFGGGDSGSIAKCLFNSHEDGVSQIAMMF